MDTWTKTCGPYPGGLILPHTHMAMGQNPNPVGPYPNPTTKIGSLKWVYSKPMFVPPVNIPIPTKIVSKMGEFTNQHGIPSPNNFDAPEVESVSPSRVLAAPRQEFSGLLILQRLVQVPKPPAHERHRQRWRWFLSFLEATFLLRHFLGKPPKKPGLWKLFCGFKLILGVFGF